MSYMCVLPDKSRIQRAVELTGYSESTILNIVDEYQNNTTWWEGNEDFPSDAYLLNYYNRQYEGTDAEIDAWWRNYAAPLFFNTLAERNAEVQRARTMFKHFYVYDYKTVDGKYVLKVAQPVKFENMTAHERGGLVGLWTSIAQHSMDEFVNSGTYNTYNKFKTSEEAKNHILDAMQARFGIGFTAKKQNGRWIVEATGEKVDTPAPIPMSDNQKDILKSNADEFAELVRQNGFNELLSHTTPSTLISKYKDNDTVNVDQVLAAIIADKNTSAQHKALAMAFLPLCKNRTYNILFANKNNKKLKDAGVKFEDSGLTNYTQKQGGGNDIFINLDSDAVKNNTTWVLLHEIGHMLTMNALALDPEYNQMVQQLMDRVVSYIKNTKGITYFETGATSKNNTKALPYNIYGLTDTREFVTEAMSNPKFQELLSQIPLYDEPQPTTGWQAFLNTIANIFKRIMGSEFNIHTNVYNALTPILGDIIAATNIAGREQLTLDSWEYNAGKSSTYQEVAKNMVEFLNSNIEQNVSSAEQQREEAPVRTYYEGDITPEPNTVFVFGSNPKGIHGAGAAATAKAKFGAKQGIGEGLQGQSYALPTKNLEKSRGTRWYRPGVKEEVEVKAWYNEHNYNEVSEHPLSQERPTSPQEIIESIKTLYQVATENPDKQFKVAHYPFGKLSLNGYLGEEMLAMFKLAGAIPANIVFNKEWVDNWDKVHTTQNSPQFSTPTGGNISAEKPQGNIPTPNYFRLADAANVDKKSVFNGEKFLDVPNGVTATKEQKVEQIRKWIANGTLPIGFKIRVSLTEEDKKLLRGIRELQETSDGNFSVGFSERQLKLIKQNDKLLKSTLFTGTELRQYARHTIFKISDMITQLATTEGMAEHYFGPAYKGVDCTGMSRIDIVNRFGINQFIDYLNNTIFNAAIHTEDNMVVSRKRRLISNNMDAFIQLGYDSLAEIEGMSLNEGMAQENQKDTTTGENAETGQLEDNDDMTIQELSGSSAEHWQVSFRGLSAISSLSKLIKRELDKMYVIDSEGNLDLDQFGMASTISSTEAVNKILKWTQGATSFNDMVERLQKHLDEEPWLNQLVGTYNPGGDKTKVAEGILISKDPANNQFKTQFFVNFKKYFQRYAVIYKSKDKGTLVNFINKEPYVQKQMDLLQSRVNGMALGNRLTLWVNEGENKGHVNLKALDRIKDDLEALRRTVVSGKPIEDAEARWIKEVYDLLDIQSPSLEVIKALFNTGNLLEELVGNPTTQEEGILSYLYRSLDHMRTATSPKQFNPLDGIRKEDDNRSNYKRLIGFISPAMSDSMESVSYEAGKLHYSYVTPNYSSRMMDKMHQSDEGFQEYIYNDFKKYSSWFFNGAKGSDQNPCNMPEGWMNYWLSKMDGKSQRERENLMEHLVVLSQDGVGYSDKSPAQYMASMVSMFLYDNTKNHAYYRIPMLSNKPSEEYIKFERLGSNYKSIIKSWHSERTFWQELARIWAVQDRKKNLSPDQLISNFDKNGDKFHFLEYLNDYLDLYERDKNKKEEDRSSDFAFSETLYNLVHARPNSEVLNAALGEASEFKTKLAEIVEKHMNIRFNEYLRDCAKEGFIELTSDGQITQVNLIKDKLGNGANARALLEEFFWNDSFATLNILQLTVSDIAFYKDSEDLQKRIAQIHSPGSTPNLDVQDAEGKPVTDGNTRTVYIKDSLITSDILPNLDVLHEKLKAQPKYKDNPTALKILEAQLDTIRAAFVHHANKGDGVNVADAQGYTSPTGYRKKMMLFGKWSDEDEKVYNKIKDGTFTDSDLNVVFQPLKPFVYSQIAKDGHNSSMPQIKMGVQNKNSEYCLIIADALFRANGINSSLSALFEVMEKSHDERSTRGIDTIQFESTVKTGKMGVIDINGMSKEQAISAIEDRIYTGGEYNNDYVHTIPFEDYSIQQEVPAHFKGEQQMGSQDRVLVIADMPNTNERGEANYVMMPQYVDENGRKVWKVKKTSVKEAKDLYYKAIVENINESVLELAQDFMLGEAYNLQYENGKWIDDKDGNKTELPKTSQAIRNIRLSELLQEEILSDPRYGTDLLWACSVNSQGEFNIPLSDPTHSYRVQQLLNSIIKNRINKQKIAGGPVVQVSSFGYSKDLNIVFKDKEGKTLMTKSQYAKKTKITDEKELAAEFNTYLKENQASIAYFECYVPIYDERFVADFADEKGNIDINKIKQACPELLDMVGYRIPTEAKYSMVPIRIKGFLPRTAGEGIMLPAEITTLSGSDFDIDKLYLMRYSFNRQEVKDKGGFIYDYLAKKGVTSENIAYEYRRAITLLNGEREADLSTDDEEMLEEWSKSTLMEVRYSLPKSGREYNNNVMLATQWAMLTSEQAMPQILSPGNFEEPKRVGYLISALEQAVAEGEDAQKAYERLSKMDVDALKDASYRKKSLLYANTQMQFHKQNMVAAKLIGVFAQANVSHAFIGLSETPVDMNFVNPFTIRRRHKTTGAMVTEEWNGNKFIDKEYDADGVNRVSATLAAYLAASVDAVKDPILNLMNINMSTVNIAVTLARLGYNAEFIGLFLSQPIIKKLVVEFNRQNAIQKTSIKEILKVFMDEMRRDNPDLQPVEDAQFVVDETMLISNIGNENTDINDDYNILGVFRNILMAADAFRLVTHMTRYNSITAAVGPSAANTAVSRIMDGEFIASPYVTDSLREAVDNPILRAFRDGAYNIEEQLLGQNFIQASNMYGFLDALTMLYNRLGYMSEKTARSFSDFFMSYYVNMKNSVFDLGIDNRRYMIDEFPLEFQKLKSAYKDNVFLSSIQLTKDKAGNPILQLKTKGLDPTETQNLRSSWADLFIQERSEGKEIKDMLSIKLVEYNFFMGSFGFSPKTFMSLVPGIIREYLPNYVDNLTDGHVIKDKSLDINNLVGQFQLNTGITDIRQMEQKDMGLVPLDSMPNWYSITNTDLPELKAMGKRNAGIARVKDGNVVKYAWVRNFNGVMRLRFVNKLGGDKQGFEIDPATDFVNMETVWESTTSDTSSADNAGEDPMMDYYRQADAENEARGIQKQQFEADELEEVGDIVLDAISSAFPNVSTQGVRFRGIESAVERTLDAVLDNSTEEEKQSLREEINKVLDDKNIC